jgi:hypothetical protein
LIGFFFLSVKELAWYDVTKASKQAQENDLSPTKEKI